MKRNIIGGGNPAGSRTLQGGQVVTTNATLRMLIRNAYRLGLTDEIVGGPSWMDTYGFDVDARPSKPVTIAEASLMMRTLLADRFKLVARKETREQPVYALVLARRDGTLGPQIKRPAGECVMVVPAFAQDARGRGDAKTPDPAKAGAWPPPGRPGRRCGVGADGDALKAGSATMTTLVTVLTPVLDRPVVDKTGLKGAFDFDLRFDAAATGFLPRLAGAPGSRGAPGLLPTVEPGSAPSIFTALPEQLGLRLEPQRGPVDVLAIHSVELPSEN